MNNLLRSCEVDETFILDHSFAESGDMTSADAAPLGALMQAMTAPSFLSDTVTGDEEDRSINLV